MAGDDILNSSPDAAPSWFTPKRLLVIFCVINMLNYLDRGAIASNGVNGSLETCDETGICSSATGIQGDFKLNNFQDGVLSSAFMVGLLLASPVFASLAKSVNPFRLIGVGLSVWTLATAGCGLSFDFWSIAICRMFVGVGEASFISLAAPFIDDNAPVSEKTAWLAMFYMCIPTGIALGYVYGGVVGTYLNWRFAFWIEALLMLPFAVFGFLVKPLQLKGFGPAECKIQSTPTLDDSASSTVEGIALSMLFISFFFICYQWRLSFSDKVREMTMLLRSLCLLPDFYGYEPSSATDIVDEGSKKKRTRYMIIQLSHLLKDLKVLLLDKVYVVNVLGYIAYNSVIGAYSYWGPKAGYNIYNMSNADLVFGGVTVVCGIFGTLAGGFILDHMTATIPNAFKLLSGATFLGAVFCFSAFCMKSLTGFIPLFVVGELLIFATQAPVNYVCLHCVEPSMRPISMAVSTVSIHIFGDVPSSPLVGVIQDSVKNWRATALILTAVLFPASAIWFIGVFLKSVDKSDKDAGASEALDPLLNEETRDDTPNNL
ncbi:Probable sphingolipid transporter spinster homolog 3 [Linum perenne]